MVVESRCLFAVKSFIQVPPPTLKRTKASPVCLLHSRRQEELQSNREEIDRQRKLLMKRKPVEGGSNSRKRGANSNQSQGGGNLPNGLGGDHDHRDLTIQEYYESEEILKVRWNEY